MHSIARKMELTRDSNPVRHDLREGDMSRRYFRAPHRATSAVT